MSNNNDNGAAMGMAVVVAIFGFMAIFIYAVAVFLAIALTILSIIAWQRPVRAFGKTLCTPLEARIFIGSGMLGAVGVFLFAVLCTILFEVQIKEGWWFYIITGGYSFVSLFVMMNLAEQHPNGLPYDPHHSGPVIEHDPAPVPQLPPSPAPAPFQYASWDDEQVMEGPGSKPECHGCWLNTVPDPNTPVFRR